MNLHLPEYNNILFCPSSQDHKHESVQKIANSLVKEAHKLAFDAEYMSPFAISAAENGFQFQGGLHNAASHQLQ